MSLLQERAAQTVQLDKADRRRAEVKRALREVLLVAALFMAYKIGRIAASGHVGEALANAQRVWNFERLLHLPSEFALQHAFLSQEWLIKILNCYYAYVHFPATAACLIFLYIWRRDRYVPTRRLLAWLTATALVVHLLMPLAPPRMLTSIGMVDTGHLFGPAVYGSPATDTLTNQYAAMPSLHFGWALAVAFAMIGASRSQSRWRLFWLAHPAITLLVVVVTGNHYWLDAVVAAALLGVVAAWLTGRATAPVPAIPRPRVGQS
jgi:PAP2 superfamily